MTATDTRPAPARRRSPVARTVGQFLGVQLYLGAWLWGVVVVIAVVLAVVFDRVEQVEGSVWETLDQGPKWFLFSMAILVVAGFFPAHVANGMTRRSFTAALAVTMAVTSAAYAVVVAIGYLVERAIFVPRGWPVTVRAEHLFTRTDQVGLIATESLVVLLVYAASGMAVGAAYYRAGGWWGTLTLPLTVGPVFLAELAVGSGWIGTGLDEVLGSPRPSAGLGVLVCLLLAAVLGAASLAVLRSAPVWTKTG